MSRFKRPYLIAGLLSPLAVGLLVLVFRGVLPSPPSHLDELILTWVLLSCAAEGFVIALHKCSEVAAPAPGVTRFREYGDAWSGVICGTVIPADEPFRGPDGRPCVAALRFGLRGLDQKRWSPFWLAIGSDRILVKMAQQTVAGLGVRSWRRAALRPRWFNRGAWAPELVAGERLDWACIREGDLVMITGSGIHWANGIAPVASDESEAGDESPYRAEGQELEVELRLRGEENDHVVVEIVHPTMQVAWDRRGILRIASIVAAGLVGCVLWGWVGYASAALGTLHPLRIALMAVGSAMLLVPIAASVSLAYLQAWSSDAPPPWMPGGKAEVLVDAVERSWVDLAVRMRWWLGGIGVAAIFAVASAVFGFAGFVTVAGVVTFVGFAYAVLGARNGDR